MYKYALLLALLASPFVSAATPEVGCSACRDVREHPQDFGNHAFNVTFAQAETDSSILNASLLVRNPSGQTALVYLARVLDYSGLSISFYPFISYQIPYPSPYVQISVQDPWGKLTSYQVLASSPALLVGDGDIDAGSDSGTESVLIEEQSDKSSGGTELTGYSVYSYPSGGLYPVYEFRIDNM